MAQCRDVRLVRQVERDAGEAVAGADHAFCRGRVLEGLAAVPHHGAQAREVGGGQRSAEQGQLAGAGVAIRVVDLGEFELGVGGDPDADPDQALAQQHAVGLAPGARRGNVGQRRVGAVHGSKDRIGAIAAREAGLHAARCDGPAERGFVAAGAAAAVVAHALEERPALIDDARQAVGGCKAAVVRKRAQVCQRRGLCCGGGDQAGAGGSDGRSEHAAALRQQP